MLLTHDVVNTDVPVLERAPETFNRVRVGVADDILAFAVVDPVLSFDEVVINCVLIGENLESFLLCILVDYGLYCAVVYNFSYHVALALHKAHHSDFSL